MNYELITILRRYYLIQEYLRPDTIEEAIQLKKKYKDCACYYAGGTQVNSERNDTIEVLISLENLALNQIEEKEDSIYIGAMTIVDTIATSNLLQKANLTALIQVAKNLGTPQIRNLATIGGNIAIHKSSADFVPCLLAYNAQLLIIKEDTTKNIISVEEYITNNCQDLILSIIIPKISPNFHIAIEKHTRTSIDLATVNIAVSFNIEEKIIRNLIIAVGSVSAYPKRLYNVENAFNNTSIENYTIEQCETIVAQNIEPISDVRGSAEFKKYLCKVYIADAIKKCIQEQ